jgi:hypothetical protein
MVPSSEQPVRAVKVPNSWPWPSTAPPGIHIAAPKWWRRAAQGDLAKLRGSGCT